MFSKEIIGMTEWQPLDQTTNTKSEAPVIADPAKKFIHDEANKLREIQDRPRIAIALENLRRISVDSQDIYERAARLVGGEQNWTDWQSTLSWAKKPVSQSGDQVALARTELDEYSRVKGKIVKGAALADELEKDVESPQRATAPERIVGAYYKLSVHILGENPKQSWIDRDLKRVAAEKKRLADEMGDEGAYWSVLESQGLVPEEFSRRFTELSVHLRLLRQFSAIDSSNLNGKERRIVRAHVAQKEIDAAKTRGLVEPNRLGLIEEWVKEGADSRLPDAVLRLYLNVPGDTPTTIREKDKMKRRSTSVRVAKTTATAVLMAHLLGGSVRSPETQQQPDVTEQVEVNQPVLIYTPTPTPESQLFSELNQLQVDTEVATTPEPKSSSGAPGSEGSAETTTTPAAPGTGESQGSKETQELQKGEDFVGPLQYRSYSTPENDGDRLGGGKEKVFWFMEKRTAHEYFREGTYSIFTNNGKNSWLRGQYNGESSAQFPADYSFEELRQRRENTPVEFYLKSTLPIASLQKWTGSSYSYYNGEYMVPMPYGFEPGSYVVTVDGQQVQQVGLYARDDGTYTLYFIVSDEMAELYKNGKVDIQIGMIKADSRLEQVLLGTPPTEYDAQKIMDMEMLPPDVQLEIKQMSQIIDPRQRAEAARDFIQNYFIYSLDPSWSDTYQRAGTTQEFFQRLYQGKHGDCDVVNTALIALLREIGLPSRLAVGFANGGGFLDKDSYKLTAAERHGWAEVYLDGKWVKLDGTPSVLDEYTQKKFAESGRETGGNIGVEEFEDLMRTEMWKALQSIRDEKELAAIAGVLAFLGQWAVMGIARARGRRRYDIAKYQANTVISESLGKTIGRPAQQKLGQLIESLTKDHVPNKGRWYHQLSTLVLPGISQVTRLAIQSQRITRLEKATDKLSRVLEQQKPVSEVLSALTGKSREIVENHIISENRTKISGSLERRLLQDLWVGGGLSRRPRTLSLDSIAQNSDTFADFQGKLTSALWLRYMDQELAKVLLKRRSSDIQLNEGGKDIYSHLIWTREAQKEAIVYWLSKRGNR